MKKMLIVLMIIACVMLTKGAVAQSDNKDCQDHPLFTRMPGYWIHSCQQKQFESYDFVIGKGKKIAVEGQYWRIFYLPKSELKSKPSELQILRNFENAIQKLGGTTVWSEKTKETLKLTKDGKEIWVEVGAEFTGKHLLVIVQKEAMAQDIVANAEIFSNDIRTTGHAAVYGIYFDTGKSTIKSESAQAIEEIAKLLKSDPALKLYVVGHTDNEGTIDSNIRLSQDRADAVIKALIQDHNIAPARLRAYGCGLFAPVASNDTEEGRSKNRRVELVKQ
jgi:OmpA-OmpF porin, OOP family